MEASQPILALATISCAIVSGLAFVERPAPTPDAQRLGAGLACLALAAAAFGAYRLARKLGLQRTGAMLAAIGFASSGFLVGHLETGAGRAAALLPWILLAIEGTLAAPSRDKWRARAALAVLAAASIFVGDARTAGFGVAAGAIWIACRKTDVRAAAGALVALLAGIASALLALPAPAAPHALSLARQRALVEARTFDFLSLGLVLIVVAIVSRWRELALHDAGAEPGRESTPRWSGILGASLCVVACAAVVARRGLPDSTRLALAADALGIAASGSYRGQVPFLDAASAHVALIVLALALASFFSPRGRILGRAGLQFLALASLLLVLGVPGVVDVWFAAPRTALVDPSSCAGVAALLASLIAGEALETSTREARQAAALVLMGLLALCYARRPEPVVNAAMGEPDAPNELVRWIDLPGRSIDGGHIAFAAAIHREIPFDRLWVRIEQLDERGRVVAGSSRGVALVEEAAPRMGGAASSEAGVDATSSAASGTESAGSIGARAAASEARMFRSPAIDVRALDDGVWRFSLDFYRRDAGGLETRSATRTIAISALARQPALTIASAVSALATIAVLLFAPAAAFAGGAWLGVILALAQAIVFAASSIERSSERGPAVVLGCGVSRPDHDRADPGAARLAETLTGRDLDRYARSSNRVLPVLNHHAESSATEATYAMSNTSMFRRQIIESDIRTSRIQSRASVRARNVSPTTESRLATPSQIRIIVSAVPTADPGNELF
jgi:hypothetical protein